MSSDFWFHKGVVLNSKDQNLSAVECYRQALKLDEKHLPSIFNLACNLEKLKCYDEAKQWFEHAINVKPIWTDALYGLTLTSIRLNLRADAVKYARRAVEIEGDKAGTHLKYVLAVAYRDNLEWDKAREAYLQVVKNEETILAYRDMISAQNKRLIERNLSDDYSQVHLDVDLYSHFQD
jgi:tetratricopeptide (TPR) repeat protein